MAIDRAFELATSALFREVRNFITPPRAGKITAIEGNGQVRVDTDDPDGGDVLAWPLSGFGYAVDDVIYVAFAVNSPDSAIVLGSKGATPTLSTNIRRSGVDTLTGEWDIGEDMAIRAERFEARDNEGLRLEDDGGNLGIVIADGGQVGIGIVPELDLHVKTNILLESGGFLRVKTTGGSAVRIVGLGGDDIAYVGGIDSAVTEMRIRTGGTNRVSVLSNGVLNVGALSSVGANILAVKAGTSTNDAAGGGVLYASTTTVGNVGTGEDQLMAYSIPANTLAVNNQSIWFEAVVRLANNANGKTFKMAYGSTVLIQFSGAGSAVDILVRGRIFRTGSATQRATATYLASSSGLSASYTTPAETLSGAVTIRGTGEATSNNDITMVSMIVGWDDANT